MKLDSIEEEIIKLYVTKNKQERILFELHNRRKRDSVFWHFAGPNQFKTECLQPIAYMSCKELEKLLSDHSGNKDVYYIGTSYVGELSVQQAVRNVHMGEICIVYCGNGFGYYQGESEYGSHPRFLLVSKTGKTGQ
jgi:hypothetical protein